MGIKSDSENSMGVRLSVTDKVTLRVTDLDFDWGHGRFYNNFNKLKNKAKYTPEQLTLTKKLLAAVEQGNIEKALDTINNGADIDLIFESRELEGTLLTLAVIKQNLSMINFLLEQNADVNYINSNGWSILTRASSEFLKIVELLLTYNADINPVRPHKSLSFSTPLIQAVSYNKLDIVIFLLKNGANVNALDGRGGTALIRAVNEGGLKTVEVLLKNGADVNTAISFGYTALMKAVEGGWLEIVKVLLENGADIITADIKKEETKKLIDSAKAADLLLNNSNYDLLKVIIYDQDLFLKRYINKIIQNEFGNDCLIRINALKNNNTIDIELKNKFTTKLRNLKQAQEDFNMECASIFAQSFEYIKNQAKDSLKDLNSNKKTITVFNGIDSFSSMPLFEIIKLWLEDRSELLENSSEIPLQITQLLEFYGQNSAFDYEKAIKILSQEVINDADLEKLYQDITNANVEIIEEHFAKLIKIVDPNIIEHFLSLTMPQNLKAKLFKTYNDFVIHQEKLQEIQDQEDKLEQEVSNESVDQQTIEQEQIYKIEDEDQLIKTNEQQLEINGAEQLTNMLLIAPDETCYDNDVDSTGNNEEANDS